MIRKFKKFNLHLKKNEKINKSKNPRLGSTVKFNFQKRGYFFTIHIFLTVNKL